MRPAVADFDALFDGFALGHARSARAAGERTLRLSIAGRPVEISFAGGACAEALGPALSHLAVETGDDPQLTIMVWDSASAAVEPPRPDWSSMPVGPKSTLPRLSRPGGHAAFDLYAGVAQIYDVERRRAVYWTEDAASLPYWDRSFPFRQTLAWFFAPTSALPMHAACLACDGKGLLLPGISGAGKSTTALRLALDGFAFLGDDYVLVDAGPPCRVWSLYRTAKVDARSLTLLPEIEADATRLRPQDDKAVVLWPTRAGGTLARDVTLSAVVLPASASPAE